MTKIKEQFVATVTHMAHEHKYLHGYGKPATEFTSIKIEHSSELRKLAVEIAGDVPLGTQFLVTVEQVDDITPAVIHRGTLPQIIQAQAPALAAPVSEAQLPAETQAAVAPPDKDKDYPF